MDRTSKMERINKTFIYTEVSHCFYAYMYTYTYTGVVCVCIYIYSYIHGANNLTQAFRDTDSCLKKLGRKCYTPYFVKCLCFEINVTLFWGETFLCRFLTTTKHVIRCTRHTQCKTGFRCYRMTTEYTHTRTRTHDILF